MQNEAIMKFGESVNKGDPIEASTIAVAMFIRECGEMAEKNWCPSQVDMLERLFGAVLHDCEYADWTPEEQPND